MPLHDEFPAGKVWLVGAGPGDPDLLTRKAERLIGKADVILYDALVGEGVLALARPDAELVSVGKRSGRHSKGQEEICALIVAYGRRGLRVVRLKGGDVSIFGRSGEELDALRGAGIEAEICPGITAASAAAASAGVSLTLRGLSRQLTLVTAHAKAGETLKLDWQALAQPQSTLCVYMGRTAARSVSAELIAAGMAPSTPVLVAVDVSLPTERLIHGRLDALGFLVRTVSENSPTLLLVGEAVRRPEMGTLVETPLAEPLETPISS